MTWVRLEDTVDEHPKFDLAGPEASWLWVCALAWSNRNRTDGRVPRQRLAKLADPRKALILSERLVTADLFEREGEDFIIHDFHDYQPSKQVLEQQQSKRSSAGRAGGKQTQSKRRANAKAKINPTPTPAPTDVVRYSQTTTVGYPQAVENGTGDLLRKRLVEACVGTNRGLVEAESGKVLELLRRHVDDRLIDECVGAALVMKDPPKLPRYFLVAVPDIAAKRGLAIPKMELSA